MYKYQPSNWHVGTWLAVLLWVSWSVSANAPRSPVDSKAYDRVAERFEDAAGRSATSGTFRAFHVSGFPVHYQSYQQLPDGSLRLVHFSWSVISLNALLCILAILSAAYLVQRVARYSLRTFFIVTGACAVAIIMRSWFGAAAVFLHSSGIQGLSVLLMFIAVFYVEVLFFLPCFVVMILCLRHACAVRLGPCSS